MIGHLLMKKKQMKKQASLFEEANECEIKR